MEGDGESVGFVAQLLKKPQRRRFPRQNDGEILAGYPHFFQSFRKADDANVSPYLLDHTLGGIDLGKASVDDDKIGFIGETTRASTRSALSLTGRFPLNGDFLLSMRSVHLPHTGVLRARFFHFVRNVHFEGRVDFSLCVRLDRFARSCIVL